MSATDAAVPTPAEPALYDRRWWALAVLCLSLLIVFVGNSSLNVAIPTLSRDLHATESQLQWVVAIYSLVFAGLLFTTGALGDRFGRKGALQAGLFLFLFGAILATVSTEMWQLIGSRAVMGAAGALIMPSTLSIIINIFPVHERPKAIAIWASITGAAGALGPVASGYLLGHFWYGSVFLINVPIIVVALVAGKFLVPKSRDPEEASLDPIGAFLSIVGIVALVYGLIEAPDKGWGERGHADRARDRGGRPGVVRGVGTAHRRAHARHALLPQPGVQHGDGWHDPRVRVHVRRDVPHLAVLPARVRLHGADGRAAPVADRAHHAGGRAVHAAAQRPIRRAPHRVLRDAEHRRPASRCSRCSRRTRRMPTSWCCVVPLTAGIALSMSPMTASIMMAVPARRAGAGSAMNDATPRARRGTRDRGVGQHRRVQVREQDRAVPPRAAARPTSPPPARRSRARTALPTTLPRPAQNVLTAAADHAFVGGIHLAVTVGSILATHQRGHRLPVPAALDGRRKVRCAARSSRSRTRLSSGSPGCHHSLPTTAMTPNVRREPAGGTMTGDLAALRGSDCG